MHLHDINNLINLQDIIITNYSISEEQKLILMLEPTTIHQVCPCCQSKKHVISAGKRNKFRSVRHLDCFEYKMILLLPMIRLICTSCDYLFTYQYSFVDERCRYTYAFQKKLADSLEGTTVQHLAKTFDVPYSTCERIVKKYLNERIPEVQAKLLNTAKDTSKLVLGIDDFAIRKGHTYNTGIHDLKNESLLVVVKGRTFSELMASELLMTKLQQLNPYAIVMDLAKSYHKFTSTLFPEAIRVADRFHVNHYITEALQSVRRRVSKGLNGKSAKYLKRHKKLLEKRSDKLTAKEQDRLVKLLSFSKEIAQVYGIKEYLIDWYELSNEINS